MSAQLPFGMPGAWAHRVPVPAARRHDESDFQATVMKYLNLALPPDAIAHHSPGEGKRTKAAQATLRRSGYQAGWPDVLVIFRGKAFLIELKTPIGRVSMAQRAMHKRLVYAGAEVMICRNLGEVYVALKEACVPLRAAPT
jgi:hypothetical protein